MTQVKLNPDKMPVHDAESFGGVVVRDFNLTAREGRQLTLKDSKPCTSNVS